MVRRTGWRAALDRQPTWVISLAYTLRLVLIALLFGAIMLASDRYLPRPWKYVPYGGMWFLVMWGYVHAAHEKRRLGMPRTRPFLPSRDG